MMGFKMTSLDNMGELSKRIVESTEALILAQLNDFVSRGLIEIQITNPVFIRTHNADQIEIRQSCTLVLKDKEYILKLEEQVKNYKQLIEKLNEALTQPTAQGEEYMKLTKLIERLQKINTDFKNQHGVEPSIFSIDNDEGALLCVKVERPQPGLTRAKKPYKRVKLGIEGLL